MKDLDRILLQRAEEQANQVRSITGNGQTTCACGAPLKAPSYTGAKPKTCGAEACLRARHREYAKAYWARRAN